jgi:hypothetical protein
MPTNPNTNSQAFSRSALGTVSAAWRDLTANQRNAWEACAAEFPIVDSLGQTVVLTGAAQFVRCNTARLRLYMPILTDVVGATGWSSNAGGLTITNGATPTMMVNCVIPNEGQVVGILASPQVSQGISYWSDYRQMAQFSDTDTSPKDIFLNYTNKFGALIPGKKIFIRIRVLNECGVWGPHSISWSTVPPDSGTRSSAAGKKNQLAATSQQTGRKRSPAGGAAPAKPGEEPEASPGEDEDER